MKTLLPLGVVLLLAASCSAASEEPAKDVSRLESLFPMIERQNLIAFRYQSWCKAIEYSRGAFASDMSGGCTCVLNSVPKKFDDRANEDIEMIRIAVLRTGLSVWAIGDTKYSEAKLAHAVFELEGGFNRHRYVYEPGYTLPKDIPNEMVHTKINASWYRVWEDWN